MASLFYPFKIVSTCFLNKFELLKKNHKRKYSIVKILFNFSNFNNYFQKNKKIKIYIKDSSSVYKLKFLKTQNKKEGD